MDGSNGEERDQDRERGEKLARTGADWVWTIIGGAVGSAGGPPGIVAGATAGTFGRLFVEWAGSEISKRLLSRKEEERIGGAFVVAGLRSREREEAGERPRSDGFFEPRDGRSSDAEELLEGTLLAAARSYEERKVSYLGRLYASLEFDETVSAAHAHFLIRLFERLTYRQIVALAYIGNTQRENERVLMGGDQIGSGLRSSASLVAELAELGTLGLVGFLQNDGSVAPPADVWGPSTITMQTIGQIALSDAGRGLYRLAELETVQEAEQDEVAAALRGERD